MTPVTRRYLLILAAVAVALAGWYAFWSHKMTAFRAALDSWRDPAAQTFALSARTVTTSGFPYRLEAVLEDAVLTRQRPDYTLTLTTRKLTLVQQPWRNGFVLAFAEAPDLRLSGPAVPAPAPALSAQSFQASLRTSSTGLIERLSVVLDTARLATPLPGLDDLRAGELQLHVRERQDPPNAKGDPDQPALWDLLVRGQKIGLGHQGDALLVLPLTIFGDLAASARLEGWARTGGTVEFTDAELTAGKVRARGNGTLALDRYRTVQFAGTVSTNDPAAIAAFLADGTLAPSRLKERARSVPLTVQDGGLTWDGKLLRAVPALAESPVARGATTGLIDRGPNQAQ